MRIGLIMSREMRAFPPKRVLIVDNDLNQRLSLAMVLNHAGYLVTTVGQACEALDRLETGNYDLIILDSMVMDNKLTLLPAVLQRFPTTSVLVFTAQWSPETAAEIELLGIGAHLEKPVTPDALLDRVGLILKNRGGNE
jgi:DNA-binding NtrC family response regulator